ncbi:MAG: hypothetical protein ACREID_03825 [Planctomycetota bacterium]
MRTALIVSLAALAGAGCKSLWMEADSGPLQGEGPHAKYTFVTIQEENRLWVFKRDAKDLATYRKGKELAKCVTRVGAGPNGMTLKAPDTETLDDFSYGKFGFRAFLGKDGRLWVFRSDAKELSEFYKSKELAKSAARIGAGPNGMTIRAPDAATIDAYLAAKVNP